jgi:hypothetical protein
MSYTSRISGVAVAVGSGTLAFLVLVGPSTSVSDSTDTGSPRAGVDVGYAKHGNIAVSNDHPQDAPADWRRLLNEIDTPGSTKSREIGSPSQDRWRLVGVGDGECGFDQRYLPRTADAIEGWYHNCASHR